MSPMNVLSIDNMQATDTSSVNTESALGPWNEGSGKFAELISQHQKETSGKSEPKGGKKTDQTDTFEVETTVSPTEIANNKDIHVAEENNSHEVDTSKQEAQTSDNSNEQTNNDVLDKDSSQQDKVITDEQAEHLKLLAMLKAAEGVSTERTSTQDKRLSTVEEEKLAKMLAKLQNLSEQEVSKLKEKLAKTAGDTPPIVINKLDFPIAYQSKTSVEAQDKLTPTTTTVATTAKQTQEELLAKLTQTSDKTVSDEKITINTENKGGISEKASILLDSHKLTKESELGHKTKLAELEPALKVELKSANTLDENNSKEINDLLVDEAKVPKEAKESSNVDKSDKNNRVESKSDQLLTNQKLTLKDENNQSTVLKEVPVNAKDTAAIKELVGNNNTSVKENSTATDKVNLAEQFGQNGHESKDQSEQEKSNNQANNQPVNMPKKEQTDFDTVQEKQEVSDTQKKEKDFVLAEVKQTVANITPKESSAFKPVEINPHNNIHSTSFVQAETQAASQVIEKSASDAIDAMTQKKTLNLHNEAISIYRKDFSAAVKDKVMVMISQKLQQIDVRLDPPELGSMHIKVNLQNEQAAVSFVVQNQQAKEALDQNMGKLREMLEQSGVDVGDANVEQQQQQASSENGSAGQRHHFDDGNATELDGQQSFVANANLYKASATNVDYYA